MSTQNPELDAKLAACISDINAAKSSDALEQLRVRFLGKKGEITELLKALGGLSAQERKSQGQAINKLKNEVAQKLSQRKDAIVLLEREAKIANEKIDITLAGRKAQVGSIHPVRRTLRRMEAIFSSVGFDLAEGPEIEDDWHNFEALNIAPNHPARAMHDTFYVDDNTVLRTHTSPVQIRYMLDHKPPIQVVAPGRVYRCDSDVTHTPMFHQLEGLVVGEEVTFADLKGVLTYFLQQYFEKDVRVRFRPSYFPFTEPSAEADVSCVFCDGEGCRVCGHSGWIEVLGCGMVHPNVLTNGGIDPEKYTGYAFGLGIERLTMMRYGINDLRMLFQNDLPMLQQFPNS